MINLIPPQGKKMVAREYITRVIAVSCLSLTFALLVSAIALVPAYVLFSSMHTAEYASPTLEVDEKTLSKAEEDMLQKASILSEQLSKDTRSLSTLTIVNHIETALSSAIVLESLTLSQGDTTSIQVRGRATTRESLQKFIETLKRDAFFADAKVPVSDLAHDIDADFTLTLTLRTET